MKKKSASRIIVAVDGPAGSGKSTVAKTVARVLNLPYIDTGAMYRALTWKAMRKKVAWSDGSGLIRLARLAKIDFRGRRGGKQRVRIDGKDVTRQIRLPGLTRNVHHVASRPGVRRQMVKLQRALGRRSGGVLEGRDIGTVVFPRARYKFYLDAKPSVRAKRRYLELRRKGPAASLRGTAWDLRLRDRRDRTRSVGRLKCAKDAIYVDTSPLSVKQVVRRVLGIIRHGRVR